MRICLLAPNFNRGSGITTVLHHLYSCLRKYPRFELFCADACRASRPEFQDRDWIEEGHYFAAAMMSANLAKSVPAACRFLGWLGTNRIDILHVHNRSLMPIVRLVRLVHPRIKLLYTAHDIYPQNHLLRWMSRGEAASISQAVGENIAATTRCGPITYTGNPFPFRPAATQVLRDDYEQRAVCIARFDTVKGHEPLLNAWRMLVDSGEERELLLLGDGGKVKQEIRDQVRRLDLERYVIFGGNVGNVQQQVERCLFAILFSRHEGFGMVVLEAADVGRATLVSRSVGIVERFSETSLLPNSLQFGDVPALAEALCTWFRDPALTLREGLNMRSFLAERFDADVVASSYAEIFDRLLTQRS